MENICIKCKRSTNTQENPCVWADNGSVVEGWTATKGKTYVEQNGNKTRGWNITQCPYFIKAEKYFDYNDIIKAIKSQIKVSKKEILSHWLYYVLSYEKITKEELPLWVKLKNTSLNTIKDAVEKELKYETNDDMKNFIIEESKKYINSMEVEKC